MPASKRTLTSFYTIIRFGQIFSSVFFQFQTRLWPSKLGGDISIWWAEFAPLVRIGLKWLPKFGGDFSIYEWYRIKTGVLWKKVKTI